MRFVELVPIGFARRFGVLGLEGESGVMRVALPSLDNLCVTDNLGLHLAQTEVYV